MSDATKHVITGIDQRGCPAVFRWVCSCGKSGDWTLLVKSERDGRRHVAAMERGK